MRFYGIRQYIRIGDEVGELCVAATAENGGRLLTDLSVEHGWEECGTEPSADGLWVRISAEGYVRALKHNVMVYPGKTTLLMLELAPSAG